MTSSRLRALICTFMITGCATVTMDYDVPINRFHSPETKGKLLNTEIGVDGSYYHQINFVRATEGGCIGTALCQSYSINESKRITSEIDFGLRLQSGIFNIVDLIAENRGPYNLGLQAQLWGRPQEDHRAGFKLSILGSYLFGGEEEEQELVKDESGEHITFRGKTTSKGQNFELIGGQRWDEMHLTYLNVFFSEIEVKGTLASVSENVIVYSGGDIESLGFLLGHKFDIFGFTEDQSLSAPFFSLGVEAGWAQTRLKSSVKRENWTAGAQGSITL